ncbi:sentrin-specific protease 2-like [Camellia sinensis]|uniref:sentrin-specific protease 2-like n=1 Tax=Camellia sinensis TaxID=4442 RepID=UPI001036C5F3|nr:sentrin-specific protease 2-like [Camellia sinensis]
MAGEKSKSVLLARRLEEALLEQLVLIPYNIGYHWILLVIDLTLMIVYLLDPINSKINTSFEIVINTALKIYETTQKKRRTNPVWKVVQSPQQPTNVECGFYVMRYMKDLIRDQSILRKQNEMKSQCDEKIFDFVFYNMDSECQQRVPPTASNRRRRELDVDHERGRGRGRGRGQGRG